MSNKNCPCVREFFYLSASTIVRNTRCVKAYTQTEQTWGNIPTTNRGGVLRLPGSFSYSGQKFHFSSTT